MPLAVIVCDSSDTAAPVAARLARLGYDVEVVARGLTSGPHADLRLEVSACTLDEAFAQAECFVTHNPDAHVLVAPGVLPTDAHSATSDDLPAPSPAAGPSPACAAAPLEALVETGAEQVEKVYSSGSTADIVSNPFPQSLPVETRSLIAPTSCEEHERLRQQELARRAEDEWRREQERLAQEAEIARRNREAEAEVLRMAEQPPPEPKAGPAAPPPAEGETDHEFIRTEALRELAARRRALVNAQSPAPLPSAVAPPPLKSRMRPRPPATARRLRRADEFKIAAISATVFAVLLMGAWSLVSQPRPAAPLSPGQVMQDSQIQQQSPFGPVTISNEPVNTSAPGRHTPPKAQAQASRPAPAKPAAAIARRKPDSRATKPTRARAQQQYEDDDSVVIIRRLPASRQQVNNRVKRYSDMD